MSTEKDDKVLSVPELESGPQPETKPLTKLQMIMITSCASLIWGAGVMQFCGIGFLLPLIGTELGSGAADAQWVATGFNIVWGSFALVSGRLSDIYGLKRSVVFGTFWTGFWLFVSAFMPNVAGLATTRAIAALGHALSCPAMTGVIGKYFPQGRPRTLAYSIMAGSGAAGAGMGWLVGGLLGSVKYNFRILSGIIGVLFLYPMIVGWLFIPKDTPHPTDKRVDWTGAVLVTSSQLALMLGLSLGIGRWSTFYVPLLFSLSGVAFIIFVLQQRYLNQRPNRVPLIPKRLFFGPGKGMLVSICAAAIWVWIGLDNMAVTGAYYYAEVLRISSFTAAIRVLPAAAAGISISIVVALTISRMPGGLLLLIACWLNGGGVTLFAVRQVESSYWHFDFWGWLVAGFASDGLMAVGNCVISAVTAPEDQGVATSMLLMSARFGSALGLALTTLLRDAVAKKHSGYGNEGQVWADESGCRAAWWFCAACLGVGGIITFFGVGKWRAPNHREHVEDGGVPVLPMERA